MPIKSSFAKNISPDLTTLKDKFGVNYGGIYFRGLRVKASTGSIGRWGHLSCERMFCSCGYSGAKILDTNNDGYNVYCPQCGKELIELRFDSGRTPKEYNTKTGSAQITSIGKDKIEVNNVTFKLTPKFPSTMTPTDADWEKPEYLEEMELEVFEKTESSIKKKADGTLNITTKYGSFHIPKTRETTEFLGDMAAICAVRSSQGKYNISPSLLEATQRFPNVFTKEMIEKEYPGGDLFEIYDTLKGMDTEGNPIPSDATVEEFLEKSGYPIALFPVGFEGRDNIRYSKSEFQMFLNTNIGKIISARNLNGQMIECANLNDIISVTLENEYNIPSKVRTDGYGWLIEAFLKDALDHYDFHKDLLSVFRNRIWELKRMGIPVNEDTIRTKVYHSYINAQKYKLKKDVDIAKEMLSNPLEALKYLQVRKEE